MEERLNLAAGGATKRGVLDLGIRCPHSCKFCYYSWHLLADGSKPVSQFQALREGRFIEIEEAKRRLGLMKSQGRLFVDITGGEPTIYPDIGEVIKFASSIGLRPRIISLGQFLLNKKDDGFMQIEQLIEYGLHDLLLSVHALKDKFDDLTGSVNGFVKLRALMDYLKKIDFSFGVNTILVNQNISDLPAIAEFLTDYPVRIFNAINQNFYYEWKGERISSTAFGMPLLKENLAKCIDILTQHNVICNVRYLPFCQLKGYERHIVNRSAVQLDPNEWLNYDVDIKFARRENMIHLDDENAFMRSCLKCAVSHICGGVNKRLAGHCSSNDFVAYHGKPIKDVLHFRSSYGASFTNKLFLEWEEKYALNDLVYKKPKMSLMNSDELKYLIKYSFYSFKIALFFRYAFWYVRHFWKKENTFLYFLNSFKIFILGIFKGKQKQKECVSEDGAVS